MISGSSSQKQIVTGPRQFIEAVYAFKNPIVANGFNCEGILKVAVKADPRICAYFDSYSTRSSASSIEYTLRYVNTDVNPKFVYLPTDLEDMIETLAIVTDKYLKAAIFVVDERFDTSRLPNLFMERYGIFFANLTSVNSEGGVFLGKKVLKVILNYRIGRVTLACWERETDAEVERLKRALFVKGTTPLEKAYIAHNYLVKTVEYWDKPEKNPVELSIKQSGYGALIKKLCVCQGFAEAYKRLLDGEEGIECHMVSGVSKKHNENHAWNVVSFDGKEFFHVDVTWDSKSTGRVSDTYFGLSDREILKSRTIEETF